MNHQIAAVPPLPTPNLFFQNPLNVNVPLGSNVNEVTKIISVASTLALPIAGLILLLILIYAGFMLMTSANNPDQAETAKKMFTTAITGFLIIFAAYWIAQLLQIIFGVPILQN